MCLVGFTQDRMRPSAGRATRWCALLIELRLHLRDYPMESAVRHEMCAAVSAHGYLLLCLTVGGGGPHRNGHNT